jgi:3-oxoacyl-[acyl-carrier protein] reductase
MASLTGKVAIVTGSSRGIGRAIAERLGKEGASVVVNYARHADQALEVVSAIEAAGGRAIAVQADMSRVADVRRLFQETVDHFGHLDILVNNAGMFQQATVAEVAEDEFDAIFALNAKGTFFALQEAARRIAGGGRIINSSSCSTAMGLPGFATYVGSKAAGEQFARALAKELGGRGITVNSVSPGFTVTDMLPSDPGWREMGA